MSNWTRLLEFVDTMERRAEREVPDGNPAAPEHVYKMGYTLLMCAARAVRMLEPKWLYPFTVTKATHLTYALKKEGWMRLHRSIHYTRLVPYTVNLRQVGRSGV